ncbi:MAG: ABC transporter ATP-binding protein [Armatimonadota bacterium]|nr:ABC transporter ATP-binding protein [Armatimonadota bacterium]MDR7445229.1 ABC transporter ATP-binding protein [Armatimonadota bacterium]MDR7571197.1 ABC transporter ATP-binding protein [Armatimonadota bacterium]MDR7615510.1 ABC transporter ATP-binding protein [Armatimonadota bacterium]
MQETLRVPRPEEGLTPAPPKVVVRNLQVTYLAGRRQVTALQDFSLEVRAGEFCCIVGPSGCGKSTFLRVLAGLVPYQAGQVEIRREDTARPLTAMVFQEHALLPWRTVLDNVAFGPENRGIPRVERYRHAREILTKMGLSGFEHAYPHQLSGGMKQRVGIARALANDPEVLLMDEPFAALDAQTRNLMQEELLRVWAQFSKTVIYVTHAIDEAVLLGDRVVVMTARPGRVKAVVPVRLERPRTLEQKGSAQFAELYNEIWHLLREEVDAALREAAYG